MSKSLYEIVAQAGVIEREIAEAGGELSPELEKQLSNIDLSLAEKVEGYAQIIDRLESNSVYWKDKANGFMAISRGLDNVVKRIKDGLKNAMIDLKKTEVYGESICYRLGTSKGTLVIDDTSRLPVAFTMQVTSTVPDKEKIRAALERLEIVPGTRLEGGYRLTKYANRERK